VAGEIDKYHILLTGFSLQLGAEDASDFSQTGLLVDQYSKHQENSAIKEPGILKCSDTHFIPSEINESYIR
jgi:hypothetical protein